MTLPRLSCSRSKAEFLRHLGLPEDDQNTRNLYREMMNEAAEGRHRTCEDISNLIPQARGLPPPYASNQIQESAKHQEVLNIYRNASPQTRVIYDLGRYWDGSNEDNWIIRWCLWHVFRYRDERNRSRNANSSRKTSSYYQVAQERLQSSQEEEEEEDDDDDDEEEEEEETQETQTQSAVRYASVGYYDPVRDL